MPRDRWKAAGKIPGQGIAEEKEGTLIIWHNFAYVQAISNCKLLVADGGGRGGAGRGNKTERGKYNFNTTGIQTGTTYATVNNNLFTLFIDKLAGDFAGKENAFNILQYLFSICGNVCSQNSKAEVRIKQLLPVSTTHLRKGKILTKNSKNLK